MCAGNLAALTYVEVPRCVLIERAEKKGRDSSDHVVASVLSLGVSVTLLSEYGSSSNMPVYSYELTFVTGVFRMTLSIRTPRTRPEDMILKRVGETKEPERKREEEWRSKVTIQGCSQGTNKCRAAGHPDR